jgi:hypothetical protein
MYSLSRCCAHFCGVGKPSWCTTRGNISPPQIVCELIPRYMNCQANQLSITLNKAQWLRVQHRYVVRYAGVEGETWLHSDEMPTIDDNGNLNNYVEIEAADPAEAARRQRIMATDGMLTADEQARIKAWLAHPTASLTSTPAAAL